MPLVRSEIICCNFCDKTVKEVSKMVSAKITVAICDQCIVQGINLMLRDGLKIVIGQHSDSSIQILKV